MIQQQLDQSPNGMTRQFTYDASTLRLSNLSAGTSGPWNNLQSLSYTYAPNGNITSLVDGVNSSQRQCFQYDQLSRLMAAFTGDASCASYSTGGVGAYNHTYGYDAIGNIVNNNGNAYSYGAKPHAATAAFGNVYSYDANGNQTLRRIAPYTHTLSYDVQGRMAGVSAVQDPVTSTIIVTAATFLYDADGTRVKGEVGDVTTVYIAGMYEWQASATTKYYDGGGTRRSGYASGNGVFYVLKDHLGSTSVIVSQAGTVRATDYYYPFGANRGGSAFSELTTKRFTGQYGESGLAGSEGLSYYGARWYDTQLGRFISPDTLVPSASNPQAFNRYMYAADNPINRVDPSGHSDTCNPALYNCGSYGAKDPKYDETAYPSPYVIGHRVRVPYRIGSLGSTRIYPLCSHGCRLGPEFDAAVMHYAHVYGIPAKLLAATQLIEYTNASDGGDWQWFIPIGDSLVGGAIDGIGTGMSPHAGIGVFTLFAMDGVSRMARKPGMGVDNIHLDAATDVQDHFAKYYGGTTMAEALSPNQNMVQTFATLLTTDGNMRYAAAYLRELADKRTGSYSDHTGDLTVNDMSIIYGAYRSGIDNGYGSLRIYRTMTDPGTIGQQFLPFMGVYDGYYP